MSFLRAWRSKLPTFGRRLAMGFYRIGLYSLIGGSMLLVFILLLAGIVELATMMSPPPPVRFI